MKFPIERLNAKAFQQVSCNLVVLEEHRSFMKFPIERLNAKVFQQVSCNLVVLEEHNRNIYLKWSNKTGWSLKSGQIY